MGIEFSAIIIFLLLGAGAGLVAGLLGVGGGLVIVPVLVFVFSDGFMPPQIIMHLAIGTSLATIVITSISSVYAHHKHGAVLWSVVQWISPGIIAGAFAGAYLASRTDSQYLQTIFGVFEIAVALQIISGFKPPAHRTVPGPLGLTVTGSVIGAISSILGIGGGTMTVPYLVWCQTRIHEAVATSAAVGLPIAIAGSIGYIVLGINDPLLPDWSTGYLYWPALVFIAISSLIFAPVGANLAHRLPTEKLRRVFALLLAILGVVMLLK